MLVNDIWGGERLFEFDTPVWEHDLDDGLRLLRLAVETHLITSHHALPLLIRGPGGLVVEMTDGTRAYNDGQLRVNVSTTSPRRRSCGSPSRRTQELRAARLHGASRSRRGGCARR